MNNFINIKVPFIIPTKDLKGSERVVFNVKTNIPISGNINTDPIYKVVIPDFIFNELADTEPQFKTTYDINNRTIKGLFGKDELTYKFKKTQTSKLISSLQEYFQDLTNIINNRHCIKNKLIKKIFIKFDYSKNHATNNLNYAYMGEHII